MVRAASVRPAEYGCRVFKRKRDDAAADDQVDQDGGTDADSQVEAASQRVPETSGQTPDDRRVDVTDSPFDRSEGPWDSSEVAEDDQVIRLDFGSLQVPGVDGMSVSLEMEEASQQVVAITISIGEAAVQLQPFAAPRSGEFWQEVRAELKKGITSSGGTVDESHGTLGAHISATVPTLTPEGENVMQSVRFVGVDGPRWLLRGVLLGNAATSDREAELFEDIMRGCVVVRGQQPMAPGDLLPLRVPAEAEAVSGELDEDEEADGDGGDYREPLNPFERGPEITEIR